MRLFQAFDDENTFAGCVFTPAETDENAQPPGPEDVKRFDVLEFVKTQESESQKIGDEIRPRNDDEDSSLRQG